MRRVGLLAAVLLSACFTIPDFAGVDPRGNDEDGDGTPDVDDPCPHLPAMQADSDGDGIGNECDPHPTDMARPDTAVFYTFNGNTVGDLAQSGVVEAQDGSVLLGATGSDAVAQLLSPVMFRETQVTIYYNILDAMPSPTSGLALRMSIDGGQLDSGGACTVSLDSGGKTTLTAVFYPQPAVTSGPADPTFVPSEALFKGDLSLDVLNCLANNFVPSGVALGAQSPLDGREPVLGSPAIVAINTRAKIEYLFIAGRP